MAIFAVRIHAGTLKYSAVVLMVVFVGAIGQDPCKDYAVISDGDRSVEDTTGRMCDITIPEMWYRFSGDAGDIIPTWCIPTQHCSTDAPTWVKGPLPKRVGEETEVDACASWDGNCCKWTWPIRAANCGDFYTFYLRETPICNLRYCGSIWNEFSMNNSHIEVREDAGIVFIPITRVGSLSQVNVICTATSSSAMDGADFVMLSSNITFDVNQTIAHCTVQLIDNHKFWPNKQFSVTLELPGHPSNTFGLQTTTYVTILEDDSHVYHCVCPSGYNVVVDRAIETCLDVNECEQFNGLCEQTCENTNGSYACSCDENSVLQEDGRTCAAKSDTCNAVEYFNGFIASIVANVVLVMLLVVFLVVPAIRRRTNANKKGLVKPDSDLQSGSATQLEESSDHQPAKEKSSQNSCAETQMAETEIVPVYEQIHQSPARHYENIASRASPEPSPYEHLHR